MCHRNINPDKFGFVGTGGNFSESPPAARMAMNRARANVRLPPEVNRVLYVRNLPYKITAEEM